LGKINVKSKIVTCNHEIIILQNIQNFIENLRLSFQKRVLYWITISFSQILCKIRKFSLKKEEVLDKWFKKKIWSITAAENLEHNSSRNWGAQVWQSSNFITLELELSVPSIGGLLSSFLLVLGDNIDLAILTQ